MATVDYAARKDCSFTKTEPPHDRGCEPPQDRDSEPPRSRGLELFRYHASANTVLCAGVISGLTFSMLGWPHPFVGFLVGAAPAFILSSIAHGLSGSQ